MSKISTFFYSFWKTMTSPHYCGDIIKAPFSFSLKYFFFYFFLYSIIGTAIFSLRTISPMRRLISVLPAKLQEIYPSELEITIKKGRVSTNVEEPYYLPLSKIEKIFSEDKVLGETTTNVKNLLVIDTKGSVDNFRDYQTLALLTERSFVILDKNNGNKFFTFDENINLTINQALVDNLITKIKPFFGYVVPSLIVVVFLSLLTFKPSYYLFYLLFFALVLLILSKIIKAEVTYKKSYQIGLHLCTLTATLFGLLSVFGFHLSFPFLQTIILLVWVGIGLNSVKREIEAQTTPNPQ